MIDPERLEIYTLTNEELQQKVIKLSAQVDNLQVQISEYRQILKELSKKLSSAEK